MENDIEEAIKAFETSSNSMIVLLNAIYGMIAFEKKKGTSDSRIVKIVTNFLDLEFPKSVKQYQEAYEIIRKIRKEED